MRFNFAPDDILRLVKQRLFWFLIPFAILAILGLFVMSQLPARYQSQAVLLVEDQQIRDDVIRSSIQSEAEQRLRRVRQEVMARDNIIRIGERFGVFEGQSLSRTQKQKVMDRRASIGINRVRTTNRPDDPSSIITTISFLDESPERAQRVANELMSQFQSTIVEIRTDQASEATRFLLEEERKIRRQIGDISDRIAEIKNENPTALPDNRRLYETSLQRVTIDLDRIDAQIAQTRTDLDVLAVQEPIFKSANNLSSEEEDLRQRRRLLDQLERQYQPTYPDVIALKEEVLDLERDLEPEAFRRRAREEIGYLGTRLGELEEGTPEHARVAERREELQAQLAATPAGTKGISASEASFAGQRLTLTSRLEQLAQQRENAERQIADLEARIAEVPAVESQLYQLDQEQERLERVLFDLQRDRAEAEMSQSMEQQQKAERTIVIEQPVRPDEPASPDKPKLAVLIFGAAAGLAGLLVLLPEVLFAKVQSKAHLQQVMPGATVIEVPRFKMAEERLPKLVTQVSLTAASLVLVVALSWTTYQTLF
jgi:uncharacterized protein involved in exopolysaccharide biosynthesis